MHDASSYSANHCLKVLYVNWEQFYRLTEKPHYEKNHIYCKLQYHMQKRYSKDMHNRKELCDYTVRSCVVWFCNYIYQQVFIMVQNKQNLEQSHL